MLIKHKLPPGVIIRPDHIDALAKHLYISFEILNGNGIQYENGDGIKTKQDLVLENKIYNELPVEVQDAFYDLAKSCIVNIGYLFGGHTYTVPEKS